MSAKKVNKDHPDCPAYINKCWVLWNKYQLLIDTEEERRKKECPNWMQCLDALETVEKRNLYTQFSTELKKLQQEYSHLFTEEE